MFIGLFFLFDILIIGVKIMNLRNSPSLIEIYEVSQGISVDLKTNFNYVIQEHGFAKDMYHYGTYKLINNLIILDKRHEILDTKRIIIQPRKVNNISEYFGYNQTATKYVAFHIDEVGNISSFPEYSVIEDNR